MSMIRCCFEPVELPEFIDTMIQKCTDPGCKWLRNEKKIDIKAIKFLFCRLSFIIISYVITETPTPNSIGSIIYGEFNSMLFFVGFVIPMHCCLYLVFFSFVFLSINMSLHWFKWTAARVYEYMCPRVEIVTEFYTECVAPLSYVCDGEFRVPYTNRMFWYYIHTYVCLHWGFVTICQYDTPLLIQSDGRHNGAAQLIIDSVLDSLYFPFTWIFHNFEQFFNYNIFVDSTWVSLFQPFLMFISMMDSRLILTFYWFSRCPFSSQLKIHWTTVIHCYCFFLLCPPFSVVLSSKAISLLFICISIKQSFFFIHIL